VNVSERGIVGWMAIGFVQRPGTLLQLCVRACEAGQLGRCWAGCVARGRVATWAGLGLLGQIGSTVPFSFLKQFLNLFPS
jgi:hypothetical protein